MNTYAGLAVIGGLLAVAIPLFIDSYRTIRRCNRAVDEFNKERAKTNAAQQALRK